MCDNIVETSASMSFNGAVITGSLSRHTALISCHRFVDDPADGGNSASWACDELSRQRRAIHTHKTKHYHKLLQVILQICTTAGMVNCFHNNSRVSGASTKAHEIPERDVAYHLI